jgi:hypothetical protein
VRRKCGPVGNDGTGRGKNYTAELYDLSFSPDVFIRRR